MQKNIKSTKFTSFVKNLKGFFFKKRKKHLKQAKEEENKNESDFFNTLKNLIISNLKKEYIIKYFQKNHAARTKIETRSVAEYLTQNEKNIFINKIKKSGIYKLYNTIQVLNIEHHKKGEIIFPYKEPTNKFCIIIEGKISLYLPYFHKKLMTIQEFLKYFFFIKKNFPKTFALIEHKNQNLFDSLETLKLSNYNMNILSDIKTDTKKEFYVEQTQKVCEISEGNSFAEIAVLYNLPQNYNVMAETDTYLLTMNRTDFMKILRPIIENEILYKEFAKLRKFSYIFNSWSNFSLGQIMNYYIPVKYIKKEVLYNQKDFSDSFYFIHEGSFDVYCELSLSEFSKYKNYVLKNDKNVLDWIREEKEKSKINIDKIIDHIKIMEETNAYPKDQDDIDKNLSYIRKRILDQGEENSQQLINIKLNEDILSEKNTKIKIKLFTLEKNDFIGFYDSIELKSRFFSVECASDKGELNKIRIIDFIVFIASNHGLDTQNIYDYIQEKKNSLIERVYKNLDIYLNNNKRIIKNVYTSAFSYLDKRKNKNVPENVYCIKNMKNLNIYPEGNNNLINRIRKSINYKKRVYSLENRKQNIEKMNSNLIDANNNNIYQKTENLKTKLRTKYNNNILLNKRAKTQTNLSSNNLTKSFSSNKNQESFKIFFLDDKNTNTNNCYNYLKDKMCFCDKDENIKTQNYSMRFPPVMYNKKFELITYKDLSIDNKLEKYLTNSLGIYNTKREKCKKQIMENKCDIKAKKRMKYLERKKIIFSNFIKDEPKRKTRVKSAYTSLRNNIMRNNNNRNDISNNKDILSIMKYLDKSRKIELYNN